MSIVCQALWGNWSSRAKRRTVAARSPQILELKSLLSLHGWILKFHPCMHILKSTIPERAGLGNSELGHGDLGMLRVFHLTWGPSCSGVEFTAYG